MLAVFKAAVKITHVLRGLLAARIGKGQSHGLLVIEQSDSQASGGRLNPCHQLFGTQIQPFSGQADFAVIRKNALLKPVGHHSAQGPPVPPDFTGLPISALDSVTSLIRVFGYPDLGGTAIKGTVDVDRVKLLKGRGLLAVTGCFFAPMTLRHLI